MHAVLATEAAQEVNVSATLPTKTEILADQEPARIECTTEELCDEIWCRHFRHGAVKTRDHDALNACGGEFGDFVPQSGDLGRRQFWSVVDACKILTRVW
jgi:hypothetical protein